MTTFVLSYLLIGFVASWCFTHIMHVETNTDWRVELAATVFWPVAALWGIVLATKERRAAKQ